jgi:hypothetical protein
MVSHCANPDCGKRLHYLREGKVFLLDVTSAHDTEKRREHFWLCGSCSGVMRLVQDEQRTVLVVADKRRPAAVLMDEAWAS